MVNLYNPLSCQESHFSYLHIGKGGVSWMTFKVSSSPDILAQVCLPVIWKSVGMSSCLPSWQVHPTATRSGPSPTQSRGPDVGQLEETSTLPSNQKHINTAAAHHSPSPPMRPRWGQGTRQGPLSADFQKN